MKCQICGYENDNNFEFCPTCGAEVGSCASVVIPDYVPPTNLEKKVFAALKDDMFLAICVLLTVSVGFYLLGGGFDVIGILAMVFLWLIFSKVKNNIIPVKHFKNISGTVYASYVVNYIAFSLFFVVSVVFGLVTFSVALTDVIGLKEAAESIYSFEEDFPAFFTAGFSFIISAIFFVVGIAGVILNAVGFKKIHKFTKSLYTSLEEGTEEVYNPQKAKNWLLVFGIFTGVGSLSGSNVFYIVSSGCTTAAYIIAYKLIKKHFCE